MSENWPAIQATAGKALSVKIPGQTEPGRYTLDRAVRVTRAMEKLAPSIGQKVERLDLAKVAALYAGVALNISGPHKTPDDSAYADAAEMLADQLKDLLNAGDLEITLRILAEHRKRKTEMPEAKLLADASALEEFGLIGLWNQTRIFHTAGKTLEQMIKLWKAQHDYSVWESRLREGFHYESARRVAQARLARMRNIYESLQQENHAEDVGGSATGHY